MHADRWPIAEDEAYALYTMLESRKWVHFGRTAKPHLQMSRRIKKAEYKQMMRKGQIWWFADRLLAERVHADVCAFLARAEVKRAGDNRAPKFSVRHDNLANVIAHCAREANIAIISEQEIFRARGLRDSKVLRHIDRKGI